MAAFVSFALPAAGLAAPSSASAVLCQPRTLGARSASNETVLRRTFLHGADAKLLGGPRFLAVGTRALPLRVVATGEDAPSDTEDAGESSYFKPRHHSHAAEVATPPELPSSTAKNLLLDEIASSDGGLGASASKRAAVEEAVAELVQSTPSTFALDSMSGLTGQWRFAWTSDRRVLATRRLLESGKPFGVQANDVLLDIDGPSMRAEGLVSVKLPAGVKVETRVGVDYRKESGKRLEEAYSSVAFMSNLSSADGVQIPETLPGGAQLQQLAGALLNTAGTLLRRLEVPLEGRYKRQLVVLYADEDMIVSRSQNGSLDVLLKVSDETSVGSREVAADEPARTVEIPIDYDS
eukprot:tig00020851_g14705.t1